MKYYSGNGDKGETYVCNTKVSKTDGLVKALGDVDELSAHIGDALSKIKYGSVRDALKKIEYDLYVLGGQLSGYADKVASAKSIGRDDVKFLESEMEAYAKDTDAIEKFIYPNGLADATSINICRAVARRAERAILEAGVKDEFILKYINRLSSFLFVLFRHLNKADNFKEETFRV